MLIRLRKPWEIVTEREVAPEGIYLDRRRFLEAAGVLGIGAAVGSIACGNTPAAKKGAAPPADEAPADIRKLYPARRNETYKLDRPISKEQIVASYNNYYEFGSSKDDPERLAQKLTIRPWQVEIAGMVQKPFRIDRDDLVRKMGLEERLYRHRCVEAWSIAVPWTGFPLKKLVELATPLSSATFVRVLSFDRPSEAPGQRQPWYTWPYFEGFRIEEAVNDLAFAVTGMYGHELLKQNGAPIGLRMPWKYGYKSPKGVVKLDFTDEQPATFWNSQQPLEYGFLSNVNPAVPHPRWSQATEKFFAPSGIEVRPTLPYNGYADQVASMYDDASRKTLS
jgi:sulfoxide reductase catalytic subunit YedY